ncbi:efflux RND transporter periplasmic adaptor subunit [Sphingosinicella sp. CPCC 101087]|uniref:efflux RND transporter periplasmic adaptor subunit n=1 Tax=Sphingosinicella sp. CPCC 101087 TaxID=2497754 RepID=UPI001FB19956|nr:efflux RND transporter periplasmic adaptor subunit [Sphingosinicella sp. CPCC 101087]
MSVVRIEKPEGRPESGGGMDRVVARGGLSNRVKIGIAAAGVLLAAFLFYWFAPSANSQTVETSRLTISTVERGRFDDFLPLRARVEPLVTVFLDAVEGGRVEQVMVEDGAMVQAGQLLAVLSNSDLQLNVLARQTEVTQQINSMRSQELALSQNRLANERAVIEAELAVQTAQRQYEMQRPLAERGYVPARQFADSRDAYEAARDRLAVLRRTQSTDERLQSSQLAQLRASTNALNQSLDLARASLDALNLRAPVAGQLTAFSIQVGQSFNRGERLGQIDSAGRNKLRAQVDEFYLGRVAEGQVATAEVAGRPYRMRVGKIYPQVRNGAFEIDLNFIGQEPADLQRGQTVQIRLTLGDPAPALLIPNGAFYNETGGNWVFVVAPDGGSAVKRQVRLGRRNADHIEVLEGLDPGERVITSPYTGFAERDRLDLSGQ